MHLWNKKYNSPTILKICICIKQEENIQKNKNKNINQVRLQCCFFNLYLKPSTRVLLYYLHWLPNQIKCSGNAKSWQETVNEHQIGRQGQPGGAQVHCNTWVTRRGGARILPTPHLRVASGGKDTFLETSVYLSPLEGNRLLLFFVLNTVIFEQIFTCCGLEIRSSAVTLVLSILLY